MAGVSTRSLAVRALLALLLVSGSLMHVRAEENIDDLEKDGPAIADYDYVYDYDSYYGCYHDDYGYHDYDDSCYHDDYGNHDYSNRGNGECSNYAESEECQEYHCRLECNLDFQNCLDDPSGCTGLSVTYGSYLTGTIPSIIGELTALTGLHLEGNDLTGSMPTELGLLTALGWLWLHDNDLTGSLSTELGLLTELETLLLWGNDLTGSLSTELGLLTELRWLWLHDNDLTGSMPTELGLLTALGWLRLDGNDLTGSLSTELGLLTELQYLSLEDNEHLCGDPVSVDSVGPYDTSGTNLGTACPTPNPDPSVDKDNRNGIMRAAVAGDTTSLAVALADPLQNIDLMDNTTLGYNALMLAAQYDHQDVARMLLDADADTDLLTSTDGVEENSWSNVMVAAWYGDQEILSMFLDASTEHLETPCDKKQMTPLHAAMSQDHCNTAAILINAGADVNALDSDGKTPLHYAAGNGNYKCLMTLMHADAVASIEDAMGNTAYTLAQAGDHQDIMVALSISGYLLRTVAQLFGAKA